MIDTVRIVWPHLRFQQLTPPPGWTSTDFTRTSADETQRGVKFHHKPSGLFASGNSLVIKTVQVSLPHILFGTNGMLIKSQAEINEALYLVGEILKEVGEPIGKIERVTRVDLAWQFRLDPRLVILAHRNARHPRIRSNTGQYVGQSLHWEGKNLHIRFYDKPLELTRRQEGNILRIEFQVQGGLLRELLAGNDTPVAHLDFTQCYLAYRELLLGFCPTSVPTISKITELLAITEAGGCTYKGSSIFDLWARDKNAEHVRRVQKKIAALRPRFFGLNWADLLPADHPPVACEIQNSDDRNTIYEVLSRSKSSHNQA